MILIKGWEPITKVRAVVLWSWLIPRPEGRWVEAAPRGEQISGAYKLVEATAKKLTKLSMMRADGKQLGASLDLLGGEWVKSRSRDVGLSYGTVGSGYIKDGFEDMEPWAQEQELRLRFGPFLGCPLMVQEDELEAIRKELYPSYTGPVRLNTEDTTTFAQALQADESKRSRGHPKLYDGVIEDMVQREYGPRVKSGGDLEDKLQTWVVNDARVWIKKLTGKDIFESTMKSYVRPLYGAKPRGRPRKVSK